MGRGLDIAALIISTAAIFTIYAFSHSITIVIAGYCLYIFANSAWMVLLRTKYIELSEPKNLGVITGISEASYNSGAALLIFASMSMEPSNTLIALMLLSICRIIFLPPIVNRMRKYVQHFS
jgi:hypothetical protein